MKASTFGWLSQILATSLLFIPNPGRRAWAVSPSARLSASSGPIAVTPDDQFVWVVNPDNDSVTLIEVANDRNRKLDEIGVGREPQNLAISPNGKWVYVANTVSGTVSVIRANRGNPHVVKEVAVGTEPYGLAFTPNGTKLYVTNARSNTVSVIDPNGDRVVKTIDDVGFEPRGVAVTNDGDADDDDEKVYVTQFLALPVSGKLDGEDDSKVGMVTVISVATDTVRDQVVLDPLRDTGFKAAGDAIRRIAPQPGEPMFVTGAYPNQLNNVAIKGDFAYLPNTGSSPNSPVQFTVNTQSLLSVIDVGTDTDAGRTINMHLAVARQINPSRLFITQPWAIAFKHSTNEGFVVSAASNIVVKVTVDPETGAPTVQQDPSDPSRVLQIKVGKNPRGIVVNSSGTRAYVANHVSRDVTVLDLTSEPEHVLGEPVPSAALPRPGTDDDMIHIGKELYNTSVGEFDPPTPGADPIVGRMSRNGWGACSTCHPFGLSDNVVWIFAAGPRRAIPQHTDFDQTDPARRTQRALNWSAIFDEEEDFELNIRGVSGGLGLIVKDDGVTQEPNVVAFDPANGGRRQLKVRGVNAWDAIKAFERFGIRAPISPVSKDDPDVVAGEALFRGANCQLCHGGPQWTSSRVRFRPPPDSGLLKVAQGMPQLIGELRTVGTFDPTLLNEVRQNAATPPLGADGFAPASLLSVFAFPKTFLHNGAVESLEAVLENVQHRSAGTGIDTLSSAQDRAALVRFLLSIDGSTEPIS